MTAVKVTKLQVARDQLDAAIELFFLSDNAVAVHTLTAAAYNVVRDLAKRDGSEFPFLKSGFIASLSPPEQKSVMAFLNGPENFFKHADQDPDGVLEFDPQLTESLLMDACSYFKINPEFRPKHYDAIKTWSGSLRADIPSDSQLGRSTLAAIQVLKTGGKRQFWRWYCNWAEASQVS